MISYKKIHIETATLNNGILWFITKEMPYLYMMDIKTGDVKQRAKIRAYSNFEPYQYLSMIFHKRKIYMIPWNANKISIYNISTEELNFIQLDKRYINCHFCGATVIEDFLFTFSTYSPVVLRFNMVNYNIDYIKFNIEKKRESDLFFGGIPYTDGAHLFFTLRNKCAIVQMNIFDLSYVIHDIDAKSKGFFGITMYKDCFFCSPELGGEDIIVVDHNYRALQNISTFSESQCPIGIYKLGNELIALTLDGGVKSEKIRTLSYHHFAVQDDEDFCAYGRNRDQILITNEGKCLFLDVINIPIEDEEIKVFSSNGALIEGFFTLKDYICSIKG